MSTPTATLTSHQLAQAFNGHLHRAATSVPQRSPHHPQLGGARALSGILDTWCRQVASRQRLLTPANVRPFRVQVHEADRTHFMGFLVGSPHLQAFAATCRDYLHAALPAYLHAGEGEEEMPGGILVLDIDEAVHGSYAGIKDADQIASQGFETVAAKYRLEAQEWVSEPWRAIQHSVVPEGVADLAINAAIGAPLGYLAYVALKAGVEEIREARTHGAALGERLDAAHAEAERLRLLRHYQHAVPGSPLEPLAQLIEIDLTLHRQQVTDLEVATDQNRWSGAIGVGSLVSGFGIASKVGTTVGTQAGLTIAAGGAGGAASLTASSTAAGAVATAAGTVSTMVLSPLAAAGAMRLGYAFVRKSTDQRREFLRRSAPTRAYLEAERSLPGVRAAQTRATGCYCDFVLRHTEQRKRFYDLFVRLNRFFLTGATVYGAGAGGTTALGGLMLLDEAPALSHSGAWGAMTALSAVGGLVMAANSWQFLHGHQRQHRYDAYLERDDPELDRHFLATVDLMAASLRMADGRPVLHPAAGLHLRARFYEQLEQRDHSRQILLRRAADAEGQFHALREGLFGDVGATEARPSLVQRLKAATWVRGKTLAKGLAEHQSLKYALGLARQARSRHTDRLNAHTLAHWLRDPEHFGTQAEFLVSALRAQRTYLQEKVALRLDILTHTLGEEEASRLRATGGELPLAVAEATSALLGRLDAGMERDQLLLSQVTLLEHELTELFQRDWAPDAPPYDPHARARILALAKERFMCLQEGHLFDPRQTRVAVAETDRKFAEHLLADAVERQIHLHGMLIDTEMQATEMRKFVGAGRPPAPAGASFAQPPGAGQ